MPYKDKAKLRAAQLAWLMKRRNNWFAENGPCVKCQSWDNLQLDHIDPKTKISHKIWSWSDERRLAELAKCQVLCKLCHKAKSDKEISKIGPSGTAWCVGHQNFLELCNFHKDLSKPNGLHQYCKSCQKNFRRPGSVVDARHRAKVKDPVRLWAGVPKL